MNIGTNEQPIKLKNINDDDESFQIERTLLHKHTKKRIKGKEQDGGDKLFKFKKLESSQDQYFTYSHNLLSNRTLTPQQIKVGLALYYILFNQKWGEIFITSTRKLDLDKIGYLGELVVKKGQRIKKFNLNEQDRLKDILESDFNITINNQKLNESLTVLHQFAYITLTEITPDNLFSGDKLEWNKRYPQKEIGKTKFRAYFRHLTLNPNMEKKLLISRWII
jgi:hypothetical protein